MDRTTELVSELSSSVSSIGSHMQVDEECDAVDAASLLQGAPPAEPSAPPDKQNPLEGTSFLRPLQDALCNLPHLPQHLAALVDLYDILDDAGLPLYLFDRVVKFIKSNARVFKKSKCLLRRKALLRKLHDIFPIAKPEGIPVAMETGNEEDAPKGYERVPRHTITVQRWSFKKILQEFLMDVNLFGDERNLVNAENPFGKYVSPNPSEDKELLAGRWYDATYDAKIDRPTQEFLMVIELYFDKTGKTAALGSYREEPVIMSSPLLKQCVREDASAWRLLAYIEDLELYSSAKKRMQNGRQGEKGRTLRDYHKIHSVILEELIEIQQSGGIQMYVRMGDEIRFVKVIPVVSVMTGDAKSGDAACARFGGKNCIGRVPRLCMTPYSRLGDPMCSCLLIKYRNLHTLYQRATDMKRPQQERNKYFQALNDTSTHLVNNAYSGVDFGINDLGVTLATASDMMHLYESGFLPHLLKVFTSSMTDSIRVEVDRLVEKLFLPLRSTCSKEFLRTNFKNGATSLTMLNSHHWPGMMFTFLMVLLTDEGKAVCSKCFAEEDVEEPDYNWEEAPPVDLTNIYVPPILDPNYEEPQGQGNAIVVNDEEAADVCGK